MLPDIDYTFFYVLCTNLIVSKGSLYVYLFELNLRNLLYLIPLRPPPAEAAGDPWISVVAIGVTVGIVFILEGISAIVCACISKKIEE